MQQIEKISSILTREGIGIFGICAFKRLAGCLRVCAAKTRLPQNAQSVIMCLFPYKTGCVPRNISRYAVVRDYHEVAGHMLDNSAKGLAWEFPGNRFVWFTDNSPIPEVYAASLCGLGKRGDNGLLIHEKYGSWVFIGEIVTDLALPESGKNTGIKECGHCGVCAQACPAGALAAGDISLCLSGISQKKGKLTARERELLRKSESAWGCDACQEACPLNRQAACTGIKEFLEGQIPVIDCDTTLHGRAFAWRGREVIRRNVEIITNR